MLLKISENLHFGRIQLNVYNYEEIKKSNSTKFTVRFVEPSKSYL